MAHMDLRHGDALLVLRSLPDNSIDSLVTDPPAGISFMGKEWDCNKGGRKQWIAWLSEIMQEALRVLKPGAHGLVWSIPRTSHWTAMALEDAGFEVRDCVTHLFGSGFPKSMDISKAINKTAGAERELAKQWEGWGTALKPAAEFWWLVRKPLSEKTVAANVQKWGTGALNIDACRIETSDNWSEKTGIGNSAGQTTYGKNTQIMGGMHSQGRFPANLVFSHTHWCTEEQCVIDCAIQQLNEQSGFSSIKPRTAKSMKAGNAGIYAGKFGGGSGHQLNDSGGASRYFYCAKISSSERNAGLKEKFNGHPTVKPKKLMGYLIKLITPPGGVVLDCFMGSGSTGLAAKENGFSFLGIEKEEEYVEISRARVQA